MEDDKVRLLRCSFMCICSYNTPGPIEFLKTTTPDGVTQGVVSTLENLWSHTILNKSQVLSPPTNTPRKGIFLLTLFITLKQKAPWHL